MLLEPSLPHCISPARRNTKLQYCREVSVSVTIQYCVNTAYLVVEILSPPDSRNILVL